MAVSNRKWSPVANANVQGTPPPATPPTSRRSRTTRPAPPKPTVRERTLADSNWLVKDSRINSHFGSPLLKAASEILNKQVDPKAPAPVGGATHMEHVNRQLGSRYGVDPTSADYKSSINNVLSSLPTGTEGVSIHLAQIPFEHKPSLGSPDQGWTGPSRGTHHMVTGDQRSFVLARFSKGDQDHHVPFYYSSGLGSEKSVKGWLPYFGHGFA